MKKIISLFQRDYKGDRLVYDEIVPGAEWVIAGEGMATRKFDGTCCLVRDGKLFKRYEGKSGGKFPANFEPATEADPVTNKIQGWVPVGDGPEDQWHREGMSNTGSIIDGTYELIGPKVQGNPEGVQWHVLIKHGAQELPEFPRSFEAIRNIFKDDLWVAEGVVWHHPDGRMVKIKKRDFWK